MHVDVLLNFMANLFGNVRTTLLIDLTILPPKGTSTEDVLVFE